ncbi:MAG: response regulator transcription factor [Bacteroidales bacterium]|nr:response regulator transcription factor [Bacteroidales bacterium]
MLLSSGHDIEITGEAADTGELFRLLSEGTPDIILLDIHLPSGSGIEAATRIADEYPDIRIIILTASKDESQFSAAVEAGVMGFITKDTGREEMVHAIREVYSGKEFFSDAVARLVLQAYINKAKETDDATAG